MRRTKENIIQAVRANTCVARVPKGDMHFVVHKHMEDTYTPLALAYQVMLDSGYETEEICFELNITENIIVKVAETIAIQKRQERWKTKMTLINNYLTLN